MTTSVILVSPGKSNHRIEIHSPTIRALNSFQSKAFPPDESWDDDVYVHMRAGDKGEIICERDRPDSRHAKLKTKVKVQDARFTALEKERARDSEKIEELLRRMSESEKKHEDTEKRREKQTITNIQQLKGTIAVLENTISTMVLVEEYEVVDGTLRSYNDRIFDLRSEPGLTPEEKETLKLNGLTYIRHLLDYKPELEFGDPNATPVDQAFYRPKGS
ncbi:hypothetical protein B0H17DRAFT_707234 [Mycena rosella]|uniref:Uncharacterized protein n=1 Tax=Mycena rosella TaxID=1033263 RepID=A0AAD7GG89_MYCRO|nr:hypothetical protein B0H17DRAFT_707234 [Mycena rosella]